MEFLHHSNMMFIPCHNMLTYPVITNTALKVTVLKESSL